MTQQNTNNNSLTIRNETLMAEVQTLHKRRSVELLLAEDVASLGKQGEIVNVKPGYARNFLLPQGLATVATESNKRAVEKHRQKQQELEQQKLKTIRTLGDAIAKYSVTLEANANEEGHLYGSIVAADISKSLRGAGYEVGPDNVRLEGPIKELGLYTVKIHLHA